MHLVLLLTCYLAPKAATKSPMTPAVDELESEEEPEDVLLDRAAIMARSNLPTEEDLETDAGDSESKLRVNRQM